MTDRFDDLLIKARAEMLGKHTLRAEPSTDAVFEYVWNGIQKGFMDGAKQGYANSRSPKEEPDNSGAKQRSQERMQTRGEKAKAKVQAQRAKAKERRQNKKTESMAQAREQSESNQANQYRQQEKKDAGHTPPGQGGTNWDQDMPDLTEEMARANPPSKQPSATDMDDIRARVDALRNPQSAADAGFAAMQPETGVQQPPSMGAQPNTGPNPPPLPEQPAPGFTPPPPPAQPMTQDRASSLLGGTTRDPSLPKPTQMNVNDPNANPWSELRGGRLSDLQPVTRPNESQQAASRLSAGAKAPTPEELEAAKAGLGNAGVQQPPSAAQAGFDAMKPDLNDSFDALEGKGRYSPDNYRQLDGQRIPEQPAPTGIPGTGRRQPSTKPIGQANQPPPTRPSISQEQRWASQIMPRGNTTPQQAPQPQEPPSGLERVMNPAASPEAGAERQANRQERREGQPQTNLFDFERSVVKDPFANPFHNPSAFDVHDNFGMNKMNPRLPKEGALDGVLARNPDPPAMNAGMPRMKDMDAYYSEQENAREESKRHFDFIEQLTAMGVDPKMLDRASMADIKQLMTSMNTTYGKPSKMPGPSLSDEPSADEYAKSFENANTSLLPAGLLKQMKGQQQASANYSLLPQGWQEEVV